MSSTQQPGTRLLLSFGIGAAVTLFLIYNVFGGTFSGITEVTSWQSVVFINILIGVSIMLFIWELSWDALRVTVTVVVALIFGFLLTTVFTLDRASRLTQGEFRVKVLSEAEAVENDDVDLEYGRQRGGEFNLPDAAEPLKEVSYTFEGHAGDVVTILAFAANRRSEVDLQVSLLDEDGNVLAEGYSASTEQVEEVYEDLNSESDAVIENFRLPADGIYAIHSQPEDLSIGTILDEALGQSRAAYDAFLRGPISRVNRWASWIQDAVTLILLGLAFAIVFRGQQISLGADGQIYFGALISGLIALNFPTAPRIIIIPAIILGAATAGFIWGLLPGALKAYLGADELVSSLMLNLVARRFYEMVLTFQLKPDDAGQIVSDWFPENALFSPMVEGTQVTVSVFLLILVVFLSWVLMRRTPIGYEIRMIGSNIKFAGYGGIDTRRTVMLVMAISGLVAGLAGGNLAIGIHRRLILNLSFSLGFEGVVVALLARNNVMVVPFTGLLYAYLRAGAQFMERDANVSFEVVRIIQAIIILLITASALVGFFQQRQRLRRTLEESHHGPQEGEPQPGTT